MTSSKHEKVWIIQRCIDAMKNVYEDWPGYCEEPMTEEEMLIALKECENKWLDYEFRGHRIRNDTL